MEGHEELENGDEEGQGEEGEEEDEKRGKGARENRHGKIEDRYREI